MPSQLFRPSLAQNKALLRLLRSFLVKVRAGLSARRALAATASEIRNPPLKEAWNDLEAQVAEGCPLSLAMRGVGGRMGAMIPHLVEQGERRGSLVSGVEDAVAFLEAQNEAEERFVRSVVRPAHILSYFFVAMYLVVVGMAFLAEGVLSKARPTDAFTSVESLTLGLSAVVRSLAGYLGGIGAALFLLLHFGPRHPLVRIRFEKLAFAIPYLSTLLRTQIRGCLALALGMGHDSNAPLVSALEAAAQSARMSIVGASLARAAEKIRLGAPWEKVFVEDGFMRKRDLPAALAAMNKGAGRAFWLERAAEWESEAVRGFRTFRAWVEMISVLLIAICAGAVALTLYVPLFVLR